MQTLLVVAKGDRASAEALEPSELVSNIRIAETILRDGHELYMDYGAWVAYYAMTMANVVKYKGFESGIVESELMGHRPDNSFRPRFVNKYLKQHRGYLVMLGWIRYFNYREATGSKLLHYRLEGPMTHVKSCAGPEDLHCRFQVLDSRLNDLGFPEAVRPYSDFKEYPAAYELHP
jgi:hypothetical protein